MRGLHITANNDGTFRRTAAGWLPFIHNRLIELVVGNKPVMANCHINLKEFKAVLATSKNGLFCSNHVIDDAVR